MDALITPYTELTASHVTYVNTGIKYDEIARRFEGRWRSIRYSKIGPNEIWTIELKTMPGEIVHWHAHNGELEYSA